MTTKPTAAVVGAGIAGLASSIALRRAGWSVVVLEKSQFRSEVGAAISIPPNATRVLSRWRFDFDKCGAVPNVASRFYHAATGETVMYEEYEDIEETMGFQSWSLHRVDLHRGLKGIATLEDGGLGEKVDGADVWSGQSRLIEDFTGKPSEVRPMGRSIYRWLVSMDDVLADPDLRPIYDGKLPGFKSWRDPVKEILWVSYTCRGGKVLNNAVVHPTQAGEGDDDLWHSHASRDQVFAMLENFHPAVPMRIVNLASEDGIKVHHLFKRPALTSFVNGRAVVIGDAAHVMMPTHAAGAAIAIESTAALEVLMAGVEAGDHTTLAKQLALFDKLRIPRCNFTMLASNAGPAWLAVPGVEQEIRRFYHGPLPPAGAMPWGHQFREALFNHDAYKAAEEALAESVA
ncbi:3-hydroxybenzoate 6-hydroxylase [Echria macrotheca]|uniref:3-hydroxybenzoate 6-hydroxylase n=1 Tax=Echria macrotheca TaxID=438768 RepID=A0AAJ0BIX7_9PEZI|nr:3-hydroxybenzoate 6-hydroxylase [Echria macrotheca]